MPDEKKIDPFKPVQPSIPGVAPKPPASEAPSSPQPSDNQPRGNAATAVWIAVSVVGVFIIFGALTLRSLSSLPKAKQPVAGTAADAPVGAAAAPQPTEALPVGPGPIATAEELQRPWSARRFLFRDPITSEPAPAMVVRLPGGAYWAFSLREPFGTCELEYVTDLKKLGTDYGFRADHPMVVNPCDRIVYDLLRYGAGASGGGLVRGEIVKGSGIRPPVAIEVRAEGKEILAVRME